MQRITRVLSIFALAFAAATFAFGQSTTGSIEGTVKDQGGAVVPGATVTAQGINVGYNRTIQADSLGYFKFQQVPSGNYRVSVAAISGFAATALESVNVSIEKSTQADLTLGVAQSTATVDVTADATGVVVDPTDSKIQTNISAQMIEKLPSGTSFTSLLKISPGTRAESKSGGFQVDGASGSENQFVIDGQDVTNFRTGTLNAVNNIPTSLVQEIQIKTSGFEAEHGGASGGVIVVSTKGGSDQWRGEFGAQFEISKFQPGFRGVDAVYQPIASTQTIYSTAQPKDRYTNFFPTGTLGGPIVKGKVWFLGSYSPQIYETRRTTTYYLSNPTVETINPLYAPEEYYSKTKYEYAFGRIDASPTNNFRAFASYLWNPAAFDGVLPYNPKAFGSIPQSVVLGGTTYRGADYNRLRGGRNNASTFNSQGVWTPTSKLVVSGRYGYSFQNEKGTSAYAIPNETRYSCSGINASYALYNTGCTLGFGTPANSLINYDVSKRYTINADASYLINDFGGRHTLKGGYEWGKVRNQVDSGYASTGWVRLYYGRDYSFLGASGNCATTPNCIGVGEMYRFGTLGDAENRYQALYIQDKWTIGNRLTLNLGLRAETENLPAFNTGSDNVGIPVNFGWGDKITPRLGAAWDIFGDGKTKIFGSYGLFTDRLKFELPRGSFGGDFYRWDVFPILSTNPQYNYYTYARILGNFTDPVGGGNPSNNGGLSNQQLDFRIPSNLPPEIYEDLGLPLGAVDPDLKPFTQEEFTVGFEREINDLFVFTSRYTRKNVKHAVEDQANIGLFESESYIIGNVAEGLAFDIRQAEGYVKQVKAKRLYNALEFTINKRLSSNYFFNANYTWSRLNGNYSGLASSDENGRASPGVTRYFDYVINGFTAYGDEDNGPLATDRPHVFKAYGGYSFDWMGSKSNSTDFNFFTTVMSGTPQTTFINIGHTSLVWKGRNDLGRTPMFTQTDLGLSHRYKFGRDDRLALVFDVNVTNAFNENNVTALGTTRYINNNTVNIEDIDPTFDSEFDVPTFALNEVLRGNIGPQLDALENLANNKHQLYGKPQGFQAARNVRFGFRLVF